MAWLYHFNQIVTHGMEGFLETAVPMISGLAEIIGLFIIVTSLVKATYHYVRATFFHGQHDFLHEMSSGLTTALEFLMSAEIAKTFLLQNLESVVPLAATFALRAMMSLMLHWEMEGGHRSGRKKEETPAGEAEKKERLIKFPSFSPVLCCVKRKNRAPALDSFAQRGYTRAIESKGADGSDSASAFCVFAGYCSGGIEGLLNKAPAHIRCGERITNRGGIIMFSSINTCWVLVAAFLVYFMQAGFALCEAGFTRAKNTGNILMKNMMDFCIGTPCYWVIGFGLMFGGTSALIGGFDPFIQGDYSHLGLDIPLWVYIVFQTVFCATAATIVSGSMAERTNFKAYCVYSAAISLVVYPICGHWMWGGGWLQSMGFHDFAGSAAVHNVGGVIALLGAAMLGPRIGKYDKDGNPHAIPGHNLTAGALGVFILWFCWFGFNGGSSLSLATDEAMTLTGLVCFNTNLAAAVATCVTMIFTWLRYGKPDVSMTLNGSLAGLVAITAGCDAVSPFGAFIIGFVAGILVVLSVEFFDKIAKIDDPVGAVSVHFANGVWGTIAVGLFSNGGDGVGKGLFYGGGFAQLGTQLLGLITVDVYVVVVMFIIFKIIDKTIGLRVPAEVEIDGLDIHEHGLTSAYAGFSISDANAAAMVPNENTDLGEDDASKASAVQMNAAVPVVKEPAVIHDGIYDTGMHKVSIIAKLSKFDQLKTALNDLGVTGMTVTQVMGCGIQKGTTEKYRGVPVDSTLLPKIKVEVIVSKISVDAVVDAAKKALYTGHIGDGKIFVYNVTRVVKIRTGEEDFAALQDVE